MCRTVNNFNPDPEYRRQQSGHGKVLMLSFDRKQDRRNPVRYTHLQRHSISTPSRLRIKDSDLTSETKGVCVSKWSMSEGPLNVKRGHLMDISFLLPSSRRYTTGPLCIRDSLILDGTDLYHFYQTDISIVLRCPVSCENDFFLRQNFFPK